MSSEQYPNGMGHEFEPNTGSKPTGPKDTIVGLNKQLRTQLTDLGKQRDLSEGEKQALALFSILDEAFAKDAANIENNQFIMNATYGGLQALSTSLESEDQSGKRDSHLVVQAKSTANIITQFVSGDEGEALYQFSNSPVLV